MLEFLYNAIIKTKKDKSIPSIIISSNSITILNSLQFCFSGKNLSNINIKGANLRNGIF